MEYRRTQVIFLVAGGIFFMWILIHALLLSPSVNRNSPPNVTKPKVMNVKSKGVIAKPPQETVAKPKEKELALKPKSVSTTSVKSSHKSCNTTPEKAVDAKVSGTAKTVGTDVSKDDHSNCVLRWLCPLFHSHHSTGEGNSKKMKSRGTQFEKKKQCTKGIMAAIPAPKKAANNAKQLGNAAPSCYRNQQQQNKASGRRSRGSHTCGGESSSSSSKNTPNMKSNLKPTQQHLAKVNAQENKLQGNAPSLSNSQCKHVDIKSLQGEAQPSSICNVLATQHDPKKQSLNQIQISVEEGRQIYNRHKWYVTFLEMKTPPALLVYLKDYIVNYIGSS